jgi:hypothetical protein
VSKLNLEDLRDIIDTDGIRGIFQLMEAVVVSMEKDVINCDINTHSFSQLAIIKAKAEGAKQLLTRTRNELKRLKGDQNV